MLDSKYALKYQMPHSVVHIVDNSANTGAATPVVVDDPSLYATIVVTGAPMGVDNRMVTLTRSDIASVAFGLGQLTTDDVKRYGQTVEYPLSLLRNASVPVRFMRVTPEGSTYAISTIVVQWRVHTGDGGKQQLQVRFNTIDPSHLNLRLDRFKNPEKLNQSIISVVPRTIGAGENLWQQRVLMNVISAGRGKAYNEFAFAIDLGNQQRKASNCRYMFTTYNMYNNLLVEQFSASLVNNSSPRMNMTSNPIESVNVAVKRRVEGSSILVPFVNESAVGEVYKAWSNLCEEVSSELSELEKRMWKLTDVNTFDIFFGNFIYDGDGTEQSLPRYALKMDSDNMAKLDDDAILEMPDSNYTANGPTVLWTKLKEHSQGINVDGSNVYVGDLYVTQVGGYARPMISLVTTINQYTGFVTTMNVRGIAKVPEFDSTKFYFESAESTTAITTKPNDWDSKYDTYFVADSADATPEQKQPVVSTSNAEFIAYFDDVAGVSNDAIDITEINKSNVLKNLIANGTIATPATESSADVYVINVTEDGVYFLKLTLSTSETEVTSFTAGDILDTNTAVMTKLVLSASENQKLVTYVDNAASLGDEKFNVGSAVIDKSTGLVYVVDYAWDSETGRDVTTGNTLIPVQSVIGNDTTQLNKAKFGIVDQTINIDQNNQMMGALYDIKRMPADSGTTPFDINRWEVTGTIGSLYRAQDTLVDVPGDFYEEDNYGINPDMSHGGVKMVGGSTGFFDNDSLNSIEFKYQYSALLVQAYRGLLDPSIMSPIRCSAKYLFDGGTNTVVTQTVITNQTYDPSTIINASTIFTDDEKDAILLDPSIIDGLGNSAADIDVKQAMYDLMIERVYLRIPEDKRPIGPGYGLELHLDSGICEAETVALINNSFNRRFTNSNCSWDLGGYVSPTNAIQYTYMKRLVDYLIPHLKSTTINKPFAQGVTAITPNEYTDYFPRIDMTDWELRNRGYLMGGNMWVPDINGNIVRTSQRTMKTDNTTSDLIQENNMRTTSQLCYLLQNKIDSKLFEYYDDGVLKTLETECNLMFVNWPGRLVQDLEIRFERDINPTDGGEIVVCWVRVVFRGLILRVPIIVDVARRV